MDDVKAKQEIVDKIKNSTNILVTVSNDPSVDALSAALGLTLLLDKLEKHATAIFSGTVPPAIAFLQPEKTFDDTTDSLRDFIIALNKDKADHLRYKVDGDVVKIFITPYKTTITNEDLQFSQGDYNVELVIALGVTDQGHLDGALEAHGQILHDATIITVSAGDQISTLGGIDWHDAQASSLGEMIAGLAEALKTDKTKSLLDQEISTALLTGIVAQTDRFSNTHTTSRVMTIAAQLMAAGADQQLIAVKLQEAGSSPAPSTAVAADEQPVASVEESKSPDIKIEHEPVSEPTDKRAEKAVPPAGIVATAPADVPAPGTPVASAYALDESTPASAEQPAAPAASPPVTTEAPAEDLGGPSHAYLDTQPSFDASVNGSGDTSAPSPAPGTLTHDTLPAPGSVDVNAPSTPTSAYALDAEITTPAPATPASLGLPMPPPVPDFPTTPPVAAPMSPIVPSSPTPTSPAPQPEILGDILAPETPPAAASGMPPVIEPMSPISPQAPAGAPQPNDPGQFRIPGQ